MRASDYNELRAFAAVVRQGNFTRAAAHLGMSSSAVSQLISALEGRLGQKLLHRTTRSVSPSPVGEVFAERLLPVLDDLDRVADLADGKAGTVVGRLRLEVDNRTVPLLTQLVPAFLRQHPQIRVEITSHDPPVELLEESYDAGIRPSVPAEEGMIAVAFGGRHRMACVASPDYLLRHRMPEHPRDLVGHDCLLSRVCHFDRPGRWQFDRTTDQGHESLKIKVDGPLVTGSSRILLSAALAGVGIGCFFTTEVALAVASGGLVPLLAEWNPASRGYELCYPSRRAPRAPLRAFVDFLRGDGQTKGAAPAAAPD